MGSAQLKQKLGTIEDRDSAGQYTNDLMGFLRALNQVTGNLENLQPEDLAQLAERRQKAFGPGQELTVSTYDQVIARLKLST